MSQMKDLSKETGSFWLNFCISSEKDRDRTNRGRLRFWSDGWSQTQHLLQILRSTNVGSLADDTQDLGLADLEADVAVIADDVTLNIER